MYKIKMETDKRFILAWTDQDKSHAGTSNSGENYSPVSRAISSKTEYIRAGFGGIKYALAYLNGEFKLDGKPSTQPQFAGVEDGPLLYLEKWFEKI